MSDNGKTNNQYFLIPSVNSAKINHLSIFAHPCSRPGHQCAFGYDMLQNDGSSSFCVFKWQRAADGTPSLTVAASFHLTHPVESICNQVGESPIQVHGGQAALVPVPGCNEFGQIGVHTFDHATDVQLPCKDEDTHSFMHQ